MVGNGLIDIFSPHISDNEDSIESRQNRRLEVNLLGGVLQVVVSAEEWVGSGQNRCPGVENGGDSGLCNRNCLLFHSFMNGDSILCLHLIKLINAHNTTISQHHSTSLKLELSSDRVADHSSGQTGG